MRFLARTLRPDSAFSASYKSIHTTFRSCHFFFSSDLYCPSRLRPHNSCSLFRMPLPALPLASESCLTRLALEAKPRPLLHLMRQLRCMQVPPT